MTGATARRKMKKLNNNRLFITAIISITISLLSIFLSFGGGITGRATSDVGFVNVTVISAAQITVHTKSINFTGTAGLGTKTSYASDDVDSRDNLPCTTNDHCGMNITNDGSVFINITISETEDLFDSGSYSANAHFLYNVTMQDPGYTTDYGVNGNCSVGYVDGLAGVGGVGYWRGVPRTPTTEVAVCYLNSTDDLGACTAEHTGDTDVCPDVARIEFNITVPSDEIAGDHSGTLTFTGAASI